MSYIVTISSFGQPASEFAEDIQLLFPDSKVEAIHWQLKRGPQPLMDLLDSRDGKEIVVKLANQLVEHLDNAKKEFKNFIIISKQAGSRIVEESLSMVKGLDKLDLKIQHIMLAPEISGTEWRSIGKFAGSALLMGLAGLALTQSKSKKGMAAAVLGIVGSAALAKKSTIADRLKPNDADEKENDEETQSDEIKFADITRHVFYNPEDATFDGITQNLYEGNFYKGVYSIEQLVSMKENDLDLQYKENKFLRTVETSKRKLLQNIVN